MHIEVCGQVLKSQSVILSCFWTKNKVLAASLIVNVSFKSILTENSYLVDVSFKSRITENSH